MVRLIATLAAAAALVLTLGSCATNPATGSHHLVFSSVAGEKERARRADEEIHHFYGFYEDQTVQDYVQRVGERVAAQTPIASWKWTFRVLDDNEVNAFTIGGGYVYIHRGLMKYMSTEAELACVLGHEIGHDVARHPARSQARGILTELGVLATAITTGSYAVAEMADIGATAWYQGYGRDNESEADRLGLEYCTRAGYRPQAMGAVFKLLKSQEAFELKRAKEEKREPNIYHGVFSDHPAPDDRLVQAVRASTHIEAPPDGWVDHREEFLKALDGLPYDSSREQGILRDNRFYHQGMRITLAFPHGWRVQNLRDRLLAIPKTKDAALRLTLEQRPDRKSPREYLLQNLKGASFAHGEELNVDGMEGYTLLTRSGSPLDGGEGPVRFAVLYRDKEAFLFVAASRSSSLGAPADDGLFLGTIRTLRRLKPSEYPLAQPYRIKVVQATEKTRIEDYADAMPVEKFKKEELELLNGLYPNREPQPGDYIKVVQ